jgi:hypothetical protein
MDGGKPKRPPMSEADFELLRTPDSELRLQCRVMSFNPDKMFARVGEAAWHNVIQAHLYLDHIVTAIITENIPKPRALKLDRISFSQKLDLISALGVVELDVISLLRAINVMRNKMAHDIDFELGSENIDYVIKRVPSHLADIIENDSYDGPELHSRRFLYSQ